MKKTLILTLTILGTLSLVSCGGTEENFSQSDDGLEIISVCASEVPHKRILDEVVSDILLENNYRLETTTLDWTIQNDAVAHDEYDANYFQHIPYLNTYNGDAKLVPAAKVHYERLCAYASNLNHKTIENGDSIEIVNDISNIERALNLLVAEGILTINDSCYVNGEFKAFDVINPHNSITFNDKYKNCELACIKESQLCSSLPDYDFGIIPGNTALSSLSSFKERICFGENDENLISERANIIAVKEVNLNSPKTLALVSALSDPRVEEYISSTFGDSVLYHYVDLTK